jgi:hypothetical protein
MDARAKYTNGSHVVRFAGHGIQCPHEVVVLEEFGARKLLITLLNAFRKALFAGIGENRKESLNPRSRGSATSRYFVG